MRRRTDPETVPIPSISDIVDDLSLEQQRLLLHWLWVRKYPVTRTRIMQFRKLLHLPRRVGGTL